MTVLQTARNALCLGLVLLLLGLAGPPARAEERAFEPAWLALTQQVVRDLEALVETAQKTRLYGARDELCEQILRFQPDHARARKWLKFKRDEGTWVRKGRYKRPRNLGRSGLRAFRSQVEEAGDAFADHALRLLTASQADGLPPDRRARALRDIAAVAPHRADVREANGEVKTAEGTWLLAESVEARGGRRGLAVAANHALDAVEAPKQARPTQIENRIRIGWTGILQGSRARMMGTVPQDELARCHRVSEACFGLLERVFDEPPARINGLTFYVLQSDAERKTLLANHPKATDAYRKASGRRASSWLPKSNLVWIKSDRTGRLEWCSRQPLASLLRRQFGVTAKHGWAFEGFGLYLTHLLTGTRGTFFVRPTGYGGGDTPKSGKLWERLKAEGADWRAEARALAGGPDAPDMRLLLGKGTNAMTMEELVFAYALAAYVLEGHPGKAGKLLRGIGKDKLAPEEAVRRVFGYDIEGLDIRLCRWLRETQ